MNPALQIMMAGANDYVPAITDPDLASLVFRMHGDGAEGSTANIVDVKGKAITLNGSPVISRAIKHWGRGAVKFPNATDDLTIAASADFAMGTGEFTFEGWFYTTNAAANQGIFMLAPTYWPASVSQAIALGLKNGNQYQVYAANTETLSSAQTLVSNAWTHFELSRVGTTTKLFINGVQMVTLTDSTNYTSQNFGLNGIWTQSPGLVNGMLQEISVYKAKGKHTAGFTPPTAPWADV